MSLTPRFKQWLHAGEESTSIVFGKSIGPILLIEFLVLAGAWILSSTIREYPYSLPALALVFIPLTVLEGRKAIIFTDFEIVYRPAFGDPVRTVIAEIQAITRSTVTVAVFLRVSRAPGLVIKLRDGRTVTIPLDFRQRDKIIRRVSMATGRAIEGAQ